MRSICDKSFTYARLERASCGTRAGTCKTYTKIRSHHAPILVSKHVDGLFRVPVDQLIHSPDDPLTRGFMKSWTRGPVDLGALLSAPGTPRCPPDPRKVDVFASGPRCYCKNVEFYRGRRQRGGPGADKNAPKSTGPRVHDFMNPRVNGSSDQWINGSAGERIRGSTNPRGNGSTGPGIGLGGRFGGAAPVR